MTTLNEVERATATALHGVADGLDVSAADLERVDGAWRGRVGRDDRSGPTMRRWVLAAAAVALSASVAVALAAGGGSKAPAVPSTTPTIAVAADDLLGVWRVDQDYMPTLWALGPDGQMYVLTAPEDVISPKENSGFHYAVTDGLLAVTAPGNCSVSWRISRGALGQLVLDRGPQWPPCADDIFDRWWVHSTVTRLVPAAGQTVQPKYQGGVLSRVTQPSGVKGTWLLQGTSRILAIGDIPTGGGPAPYVLTDRADAAMAGDAAAVHERGQVVVSAAGEVTFRPDEDACVRMYLPVLTDYASLKTQLVSSSCGPLGGSADTWIRLN